MHRLIHFPAAQREINEKQAAFMQIDSFPGVIGVIKGKHIDLSTEENAYVNCKHWKHCINIQVIIYCKLCDSCQMAWTHTLLEGPKWEHTKTFWQIIVVPSDRQLYYRDFEKFSLHKGWWFHVTESHYERLSKPNWSIICY